MANCGEDLHQWFVEPDVAALDADCDEGRDAASMDDRAEMRSGAAAAQAEA